MSNYTIEGPVQEKGQSSSGKDKVKVNGAWFYAGNCDISSMQVGQRVQIEGHDFPTPRGGSLHGVDAWNVVAAGSAPTAPATPTRPPTYDGVHAAPASVPTLKQADNVYSPGQGCKGLDEAQLRFVSNVVGNAAAAGKISDPTEIERWFDHAKAVVLGQEYLDDKIPY